jgi:hypothetical protein
MDWLKDTNAPSWARFAVCLLMQIWIPSSSLILYIMKCSSTIIFLIPLSIATRVQMPLMENHSISRSSTSWLVFDRLFNHRSFCISWIYDQQKDSFLVLTLLASKFLNGAVAFAPKGITAVDWVASKPYRW